MFPANKRTKAERGQALVLATMSILVLIGMLSLVIDLGLASYKVQQGQTAADAAAMSAAVNALNNGHTCGQNGVQCGTVYHCANPNVTPPTTNLQVGCLYAEANGFRNTGNQSVWLNADSSVPPGATNNKVVYWVQATVSESIPGLFYIAQNRGLGTAALMLLSIRTSSSSAVSTAAVTITPAGSCIYAMDPSASAALSVGGSATVNSSCGIFVNSSSASALKLNGSAIVHSTIIQVHGNYSANSNATYSPTPTTGAAALTDPLANLPTPSFANSCDYINWNWPSSTNVTLNPGTYCGGITISGSGTITFNPGIYIINGGGFNWSGSATLNGARVMFFITGQYGYTAAALNASGNGSINLSAPDSGPYEGLLFYQDRNLSYATANTFNGNANSNTTGAFYFPTTSLTYSGSSTGRYQALVAKTITMTGNSNFLNDPTGTFTALASKTASLIQ